MNAFLLSEYRNKRGSPTHIYQFMKSIDEEPIVLFYHLDRSGEIPTIHIHHLRSLCVGDTRRGGRIKTDRQTYIAK